MSRRIAHYSSHGMFAGAVRKLVHVEGPQLWKIVVAVTRENGSYDHHTIEPDAKIPISALSAIVQRTIDEVAGPGPKITRADMEFFVRKPK